VASFIGVPRYAMDGMKDVATFDPFTLYTVAGILRA
jgi:hypothetical protein